MPGPERRRRLAVCVVFVTGIVLPRTARSHPDVDQARRSFEAAEFDAALAAIERAERSRDLVRADVVDLLEARALVSWALGRLDAAAAALERLAALEPRHPFAPGTNPDVVARFEAVRDRRDGPLGVHVQSRPTLDGLELQAKPLRAPQGLVTAMVLHVRAGSEAWHAHEGDRLRVPLAAADATVVYRGEAIGPGGAALATSPVETWRRPVTASPDRSSRAVWTWGAAATVVAAGVATALLLGSTATTSRPDRPAVAWP